MDKTEESMPPAVNDKEEKLPQISDHVEICIPKGAEDKAERKDTLRPLETQNTKKE